MLLRQCEQGAVAERTCPTRQCPLITFHDFKMASMITMENRVMQLAIMWYCKSVSSALLRLRSRTHSPLFLASPDCLNGLSQLRPRIAFRLRRTAFMPMQCRMRDDMTEAESRTFDIYLDQWSCSHCDRQAQSRPSCQCSCRGSFAGCAHHRAHYCMACIADHSPAHDQ